MDFGPWLPDLVDVNHEGLTVARNVYSRANGYGPIKAIDPLTTALPRINGGAAFVALNGVTALLGGRDNGLFQFVGGDWDEVYAVASGPWRFAQFGDNVISVNGGETISYDIQSSTAAPLGGTPPAASLVATVRDFVWLAGDPSNRQTLSISGYNDSTEWTPGTNQATEQTFPDGGPIYGLAGGEYGLILQRSSIKRGSYLGDGTVNWQFDEISANIGCIASGSVVQAGRLVGFLSERGFMICDGNDVTPIGNEQVDDTFFKMYSRADLQLMTSAVDPRRFLFMWAMPGSPGRIWIHNWLTKRWSYAELPLGVVFSAFTANVSIDDLDAIYPGGIDTVPVSLDSPQFAGGDPLLLVSDETGIVGPLAGDNLPATLTTAKIELSPGRVTKINNTLPVTDAQTLVVTIVTQERLNGPTLTKSSSDLRASGHMPIRTSGRYSQITMSINDIDFQYAKGIEINPVSAEVR